MTSAELTQRKRLHTRAVLVLEALLRIQRDLEAEPSEDACARLPADDRQRLLDERWAVDAHTYETEARLALVPLAEEGA